jgi:hypothetical protein
MSQFYEFHAYCKNCVDGSRYAGLCSRTKLQRMQRFFPLMFFNPQLSQTIMNKLTAYPIRTNSIRKLSTDILNHIREVSSWQKIKLSEENKYRCPKCNNGKLRTLEYRTPKSDGRKRYSLDVRVCHLCKCIVSDDSEIIFVDAKTGIQLADITTWE